MKDILKHFIIGILFGSIAVAVAGAVLYKSGKTPDKIEKLAAKALRPYSVWIPRFYKMVEERFDRPIKPFAGETFGVEDQLAFELYRGGTFEIDGKSGYAWQKSPHYGDVALIRSSKPLPDTYKVRVTAGEIDYSLDKISGLVKDPNYREGPLNENGFYLLAITDEIPSGHHTNTWWHQHRKLVIDVDNNVWGHGMPNPIFMVYFNRKNELMSYDRATDRWTSNWVSNVHYDPKGWYTAEIEKTPYEYVLRLFDGKGKLLQQSRVDRAEVWRSGSEEYLVVGDPHENYYQGSVKIKSIAIPAE